MLVIVNSYNTIECKDLVYTSSEVLIDYIRKEIQTIVEDSIEEIEYFEELMLNSLIHFCNTGKFLTEE